MVKRRRGATWLHDTRAGILVAVILVAIAGPHRPAWSMVDGKMVIMEGRVRLRPNTDSATRVRLTDTDGKEWVVIGPFRPELERLAIDVPDTRVVVVFRSGSAQVEDITKMCFNLGRLCTSSSTKRPTLMVEQYWFQSVYDVPTTVGPLRQPVADWLEISGSYGSSVRFPANEWSPQPYWKALGCQAWVSAASRDRIGSCSPGECITSHVARSGLLRCGPNPAEGPTLSRPTGLDWLACDAEMASTRWYCRLRDAKNVRKDLPKSMPVNGGNLAVGPVLEPLLRQGTLLSPHLRFVLDWVDSPRCRQLALLNYPLDVKARGIWVGSVYPGRRSYDFDLGRDGGPSAWVVDPGAMLVVTTDLAFASRYGDPKQYVPVTPAGYLESVPGECALALSNIELVFDVKAIQRELDLLQQHAMTSIDLLAARAVIHAQYLDASRGALCAVNRVAQATLGAVQELSGQPVELDGLLAVSPSAYAAISSALLEAQVLGALPPSASDPWRWFVANQFTVDQECGFSSPASGQPTEQAFAAFSGAIRDQGVANARAYLRDATQLKALQTRAWALAVAGNLRIENPDEQWMLLSL